MERLAHAKHSSDEPVSTYLHRPQPGKPAASARSPSRWWSATGVSVQGERELEPALGARLYSSRLSEEPDHVVRPCDLDRAALHVAARPLPLLDQAAEQEELLAVLECVPPLHLRARPARRFAYDSPLAEARHHDVPARKPVACGRLIWPELRHDGTPLDY